MIKCVGKESIITHVSVSGKYLVHGWNWPKSALKLIKSKQRLEWETLIGKNVMVKDNESPVSGPWTLVSVDSENRVSLARPGELVQVTNVVSVEEVKVDHKRELFEKLKGKRVKGLDHKGQAAIGILVDFDGMYDDLVYGVQKENTIYKHITFCSFVEEIKPKSILEEVDEIVGASLSAIKAHMAEKTKHKYDHLKGKKVLVSDDKVYWCNATFHGYFPNSHAPYVVKNIYDNPVYFKYLAVIQEQ
jgi:hypothetical protein